MQKQPSNGSSKFPARMGDVEISALHNIGDMDVPPMNPSIDAGKFGENFNREAEGVVIRNYFSNLRPEDFHHSTISATCIFHLEIADHPENAKKRPNVRIVTGDSDGNVKLWNVWKGTLIADWAFHRKKIKALVSYRTKNGEVRIVSGSEDKSICIWDNASTKRLKVHTCGDAVHCLTVCQITGMLVVGTADRNITVFMIDQEQDPAYHIFDTGHTDLILSLSIITANKEPDPDPDNSFIISVGWDKRMLVYNRQGRKIGEFDKGHTKSITTMIAHFPSGEEERFSNIDTTPVLITGSLDKTAIIWDFATRRKVRVLEGHTGQINAVKVSDRNDDGSPPIVITASLDKTIILWDLLSGARIRTIDHLEALFTLSIIDSAEGVIVISSGTTPSLLVWDLRRTNRTRTYQTGAVTTIDLYAPPYDKKNPQIIIGDVKQKFTIFSMQDPVHKLAEPEFHLKRINAAALYQPVAGVANALQSTIPLMISADGNAEIKVWSLDLSPGNEPTELRSFRKHEIVVMTVAIYDSILFGRTRKPSRKRTKLPDGQPAKVNLDIPCVLSGGADRSIKVWDFMGITGNDLLAEVPFAHMSTIRSIVVYHPVDPQEKPLFISGSYDKTVILWDLETLQPIRSFQGVHTDYVFFTAIYDPRVQYDQSNPKLPFVKTCPAVISSSYDRSFAIWNMFDDPNVPSDFSPRLHKREAHLDSITALAVYTPPPGTEENPLVITGSIDRLIHVWNLFTGELIQTLIGHEDRVCYLKVYDPPGQPPVVLSGGDDEKTILWEDTLYQRPFMPLREAINNAFDSDIKMRDWPMITALTRQYGSQLFLANSNLFVLAIRRNRPDFILQFWDYLTLTLPTIKKEPFNADVEVAARQSYFRSISARSQQRDNTTTNNNNNSNSNDNNSIEKEYDILSIAIKKFDLISVRAIVLSWIKNLNTDMDDMLTQRSYHPSYFFPDEALELLCQFYPSEAIKFISSLRLVRNSFELMGGTKLKYIAAECRYYLQGSDHRALHYHDFWENFHEGSDPNAVVLTNRKSCYFLDRCIIIIDQFVMEIVYRLRTFFEHTKEQQPVTVMMVPFKNCHKVAQYLNMFVKVSNRLDDVSIFDSEVGMAFLRYYWRIRGRRVHVLAFLKYLLFFILFLICIYSYEPHYSAYPGLITVSYLCLLGFVWFGYEELLQMQRTYGDISTYHMISHFADLWNAVDIIIVFNGILGLLLRIGYGCDTSTGRACLAITSVFMWFKILYFLRPFSTTGPLVAMILQIISEIRVYIVVLFCVLAGFAQAFWILSNNDESLLFGTISQSFLNSFLYMLGQNVVADFSGTASPYVATIFLVFFLITMMILMLNLLIALMGDVFSKVRSRGVGLWRKEQAAIMAEESFMYDTSERIPRHLFVLQYSSDVKQSEIDFREEVQYLIDTSDFPALPPANFKAEEEIRDGVRGMSERRKSERKSIYRELGK